MASRMENIGNGFWNLRGSFTFAGGLIDIGTHMAFIELPNGKVLVIDTCDFNTTDKAEIDRLTGNGERIEAVIATHAFHTMYFQKFQKLYPNAPYYGTSRHLKRIPIPWAGDITAPENLSRWEQYGVFIRVPEGAEVVPADESNHFSGLFVFHQASRTLFNDDTILHFSHPGCVLRCVGKTHGTAEFWDLKGLKTEKGAPLAFQTFIEGVLNDWDIDNLVLAHTGNVIGGGKDKLRETLNKARPALEKLDKKYT